MTNCTGYGAWGCQEGQYNYRTENESFFRIKRTARTWTHAYGCWDEGVAQQARVVNDAYWQVWDRGGTRYEFGKSDYDQVIAVKNSAGANHWPFYGESGLAADSSRTYRIGQNRFEYKGFFLERIVDPHGNTVEIDYGSHSSPGTFSAGNCPVFSDYGYNRTWKETYPQVIRYTSNPALSDTHAEYRVVFDVQAKGFDARDTKAVSQSGYKLMGVQVQFHPTSGTPVVMREYRFEYATVGESLRLTTIRQYGLGGVAGGQQLPPLTFSYQSWPIAYGGVEYSRPFLTTVNNGYGGTLTFGYQSWCYGGGTCGGLVDDYMKQVVASETLNPGVGAAAVYRYAYSDPGLEQSDAGGAPHMLVGFGRVEETIDGVSRRAVTLFENTAESGPTDGDADDPYKGKPLQTWVEESDGDPVQPHDDNLRRWPGGVELAGKRPLYLCQPGGGRDVRGGQRVPEQKDGLLL